MSTRSEITIKKGGYSVKLYHHWDGYPEGVGFDLIEKIGNYLEDAKKYETSLRFDLIVNKILDDRSYEFTIGNHADREYEYFIDLDYFEIHCFEVEIDWETGFLINRKKIDLYKLYEQASKEKEND